MSRPAGHAAAAGQAAAIRKPSTASDDETARFRLLSQREQILLRPDTSLGAVVLSDELALAVLDDWDADTAVLRVRAVRYVPGLLKIVDEALLNGADQAVRGTTALRVTLDAAAATFTVRNEGSSLPIAVHAKERIYVPELVFGHFNTSSNYDDTQRRTVGGRNGHGAKLANVMARRFELRVGRGGSLYEQSWEANMSRVSAPRITKTGAATDFVQVTVAVDMTRFGGAGAAQGAHSFDADTAALMARRVVDVAACNGALRVTLNGRAVDVHSLEHYARCELGERAVFKQKSARPEKRSRVEAATTTTTTTTTAAAEDVAAQDAQARTPLACAQLGERWELVVRAADAPAQTSFVNSIATTRGGPHVRLVAERVVVELVKAAERRRGAKPTAAQLRAHMHVYVRCLVENPAFDSQTKECLTTAVREFGSAPAALPSSFAAALARCGIVERAAEAAEAAAAVRDERALVRASKAGGAAGGGGPNARRRITGLPKLDDANEAGGRRAAECTLILTEGDSAKALAVAGLAVLGRDLFGVFPLRGKVLNVREATVKQAAENAEILAVRRILGLEHKKNYETAAARCTLRYGALMLMMDQDHDGAHIKALVINFLHYYFPELLRVPNFVQCFITPIVKAARGQGALRRVETFYTLPQYEAWLQTPTGAHAGWQIKYYKGLGTSTAAEAREYFADLPRHRVVYAYGGPQDDEAIRLAFEKKRADDRKAWLASIDPRTTYVDYTRPTLSYADMVNRELVLFSHADCVRSIPDYADGLKPGQRKILFACLKRKLVQDLKVAQLAGYVSERAAYHHGEAALTQTIVGMAQDFVGSNNLNLLVPSGQFGTRLKGGKDAASARYIFTRLSPLARLVFPAADDALLDALVDDGQRVEPRRYLPVLPMVLVNGAEGIGTGWSSSVPCFAPRALISQLRRRLAGEPLELLVPWYRGFAGTIVLDVATSEAPAHYTVRGSYVYDPAGAPETLEITELPLGVWTESYKALLEEMAAGNTERTPPTHSCIVDYKELHTETRVRFLVTLRPAGVALVKRDGVEKVFKLAASISTTNLVLFDDAGKIRRYSNVDEIFEEFVAARFALYKRRRLHLIGELEREFAVADNKARFVRDIIARELVISGLADAALEAVLAGAGYARLGTPRAAPVAQDDDDTGHTSVGGAAASDPGTGAGQLRAFGYLLGMPLTALTSARVAQLEAERARKAAELARLRASTARSLWLDDLAALEHGLDEAEAAAALEAAKSAWHGAGAPKHKAPRAAKSAVARVAAPAAQPTSATFATATKRRRNEETLPQQI